MSSRTVNKFVLPLLIFPLLSALGFKLVIGHTDASGWGEKLKLQCLQDPDNPYALPYTSVAQIDTALCVIVSVFQASFTSVSLPFTVWFLVSAVPVSVFTYIEANRRKAPSFPLSYPVLAGIFMQAASFAATFPAYWLLAILTGVTSLRPSKGTMVSRAHSEAVMFGIFIGMFIPTISMFALNHPHVTAIWQFFPLFISLAIAVHLLVRPSYKEDESGYTIISVLYIASFIISSSMHLAVVSSRYHDFELLRSFFIPSMSVLELSEADAYHVLHLLQWDAIFGFGSTILGSLWFARSLSQFFGLLIWNVLAVPIIGPGAAFAGTALWRESYLHSEENVSGTQKK